MEVRIAELNSLVQSQFPIFQEDGFTRYSGIPPGDFSIQVFKDNSESSEVATVSEIGTTGVYVVDFTPVSEGTWHVNVALDTTGDVWGMIVEARAVSSLELSEAQMNIAYDEDSGVIFIEVWLDRKGQTILQGDLVSCSVTVYDEVGVLQFTEMSNSPKIDGHFGMSRSVALDENRPYSALVTVTDSKGSVTTSQAFSTVG